MERLRKEVLNEYFFEAVVRDDSGRILPAPSEAVARYNFLKEDWLMNHPKLPYEIPSIALFPVCEEDRQGYVVATLIIYKPLPDLTRTGGR